VLRQLISRRAARRLPFFKVLAVAEVAMMARRHLQYLEPAERRRLAELVRRGRGLTPSERDELRQIAGKLEPRLFAGAALDKLSPVPLPGSITGRRR
jgi:hypothetical protein